MASKIPAVGRLVHLVTLLLLVRGCGVGRGASLGSRCVRSGFTYARYVLVGLPT